MLPLVKRAVQSILTGAGVFNIKSFARTRNEGATNHASRTAALKFVFLVRHNRALIDIKPSGASSLGALLPLFECLVRALICRQKLRRDARRVRKWDSGHASGMWSSISTELSLRTGPQK
ncbi:hypothetical protein AAFF_G00407590 [Aldrovandia affinis]|uniref:Uncharacterized protein n=1 Tax=Aldrovandia affinis TaxID=143900 RepID=A0AAD7SBQ4_9TELE|nr:hypothetical protein AAFF_G00407590 [Aldrovandia affinis]